MFTEFFARATGHNPYPYQVRLAEAESLPDMLCIPTGLGKTAAVVLAWVWRRYLADGESRKGTPRRLVYCLPTRVLVRQTASAIEGWLKNLDLSVEPSGSQLRVHQLMGGEPDSPRIGVSWEATPEDSAIIVGTQDMLLSRALNRGYAMSRFSWPIHFALLNNDALWVLDETQLMGPGLTTSAQLAGLRKSLSTGMPSHSIWMSATLDAGNLRTFDNRRDFSTELLTGPDRADPEVARKAGARKLCSPATRGDGSPITIDSPSYEKDLAAFIESVHRPGSQTMVVVNTVGRSQEVFRKLSRSSMPVLLIHSGFRRKERDPHEDVLFSPVGEAGRIVVCTQVIEAGVDISSATLITEPAPWPSLVQRMGRCNRYGEYNDAGARVFWVGPSQKDTDHLPYPHGEVLLGIDLLGGLSEVSPAVLASIPLPPGPPSVQVLRKKDLLDLFDTTPDLLGFDLDVNRFIRETDEPDVHVFWRDLNGERPGESVEEASPAELCRVGLRQFAVFIKKAEQPSCFTWDHQSGRWSSVFGNRLLPGRTYLLDTASGGYSDMLGWTGNSKDQPSDSEGGHQADYQIADPAVGSVHGKVSLFDHSGRTAREVDSLSGLVDRETAEILHRAALLHDAGKAHPVFQEAVGATGDCILAKSPEFKPYSRRGFRHELASALIALQNGESPLLCYLIAAHHGKVRSSLRSNPLEAPAGERFIRYAKGIHEGDEIPEIELPEGLRLPRTVLDLSPMDLGGDGTGPSWRGMTQDILERFGPFRLSWMEALLRVADWRASAREAGDA